MSAPLVPGNLTYSNKRGLGRKGVASFWLFIRASPAQEERDDLINPFWIEDRDLGRGEVDYLSGPEIQFWKDLIDKYLYPIDSDKAKEVGSWPRSVDNSTIQKGSLSCRIINRRFFH